MLHESNTAKTKDEAIDEFCQLVIPENVLNQTYYPQEDGSFAFEYELPKISELSFKATFKHFDAEITFEELAPTIITATLRNVKEPLDTIEK
ncbi:MAG: hypothetical protein NY202_01975 [Mollicutes bacterium UO1]